MRKSHDLTKKEFIVLIGILIIAGMSLFTYDYLQATYYFDNRIYRNQAGSGESIHELSVEVDGQMRDVDIELNPVAFTEDEANVLLEQAKRECLESILGKNESLDKVMYDLKHKQWLCEDLVEAKYRYSDTDIISSEGKINHDNLKGPTTVMMEVTLSVEQYETIITVPIGVIPWDSNIKEGFDYYLNKEISEINESKQSEPQVLLPELVADKYVTWHKQIDYRGLKLIAIAIVAGSVFPLMDYSQRKKSRKMRQELRLRDYPVIVNELSILMGAGMSIKSAFGKMSERYLSKRDTAGIKEGYELILKAYRRMTEGVGEIEAIDILGRESDVKEYRKLAMLLSQNLRKGNRELLTNLEREEINAFELRKQLALQAGEKASTKLLLPIGGMMGIVLVVLMVPALLQINL